MINRFAVAACAVLLVVPALVRSQSYAPAGYALRWAEDFNGPALDSSKWMYRTDVKMESSQKPENVSLSGGNLVIHLRKETDRGKQYTGGGVVSRRRFRYGYYEARIRMHGAAGWHQSFWAMRASDGSTTYLPEMRTEIDAMEFDSDIPWKGHIGLIKWNGPSKNRTTSCSPGVYRRPLGFDASAGFHVYAFEWTEKTLRVYLDGDLQCALNYPPYDHEHDRINLWLTAIAYARASGGKIDDAGLPGEMLVDRVAYYERDLYVDPGEKGYREAGEWGRAPVAGYSHSGARQSCAGVSYASWTPDVLAEGDYIVSLYRPPITPGRGMAELPSAAPVAVEFAPEMSGWKELGRVHLKPGGGASVRLTRHGGCIAADMLKFVRQP